VPWQAGQGFLSRLVPWPLHKLQGCISYVELSMWVTPFQGLPESDLSRSLAGEGGKVGALAGGLAHGSYPNLRATTIVTCYDNLIKRQNLKER
jgi:hypothetical protein